MWSTKISHQQDGMHVGCTQYSGCRTLTNIPSPYWTVRLQSVVQDSHSSVGGHQGSLGVMLCHREGSSQCSKGLRSFTTPRTASSMTRHHTPDNRDLRHYDAKLRCGKNVSQMPAEEIVPAFMGMLRKTLAAIYDGQSPCEDSKQTPHESHPVQY